MGAFFIEGGQKLSGEIMVDGAKNAVLPILAATVINPGESVIHNAPWIKDVDTLCAMLERIGCRLHRVENTITVNALTANEIHIPEKEVREMRSSIILLGAMLTRFGEAEIVYPGGCDLGPRPIDMHLNGLKQLGVKVEESHGYIYCSCDKIVGAEIPFDIPSVGATENMMLASVKAKGTTVIQNAAREPEIIDLQNFLNRMGAKVSGAGSSTVVIEGVSTLHDAEFCVMPDRIVTGTYMAAAAVTGGDILMTQTDSSTLRPVIAKFRESGCAIKDFGSRIHLRAGRQLRGIDLIKTMPYPGFPTDMQAQMMSMLSMAFGTSVIIETIFENRFKHAEELTKMGANITIEGRTAIIRGVKRLTGAEVVARDLRGAAALVVAALAAEGTSQVDNIDIHLDRGYDRLDEKLRLLGAKIRRA